MGQFQGEGLDLEVVGLESLGVSFGLRLQHRDRRLHGLLQLRWDGRGEVQTLELSGQIHGCHDTRPSTRQPAPILGLAAFCSNAADTGSDLPSGPR